MVVRYPLLDGYVRRSPSPLAGTRSESVHSVIVIGLRRVGNMKRLLSITEYAFLCASVLSYIFTVNTNDCTETILGSALVVVFAILSAIRGELYEKKKVRRYTVINRAILSHRR